MQAEARLVISTPLWLGDGCPPDCGTEQYSVYRVWMSGILRDATHGFSHVWGRQSMALLARDHIRRLKSMIWMPVAVGRGLCRPRLLADFASPYS